MLPFPQRVSLLSAKSIFNFLAQVKLIRVDRSGEKVRHWNSTERAVNLKIKPKCTRLVLQKVSGEKSKLTARYSPWGCRFWDKNYLQITLSWWFEFWIQLIKNSSSSLLSVLNSYLPQLSIFKPIAIIMLVRKSSERETANLWKF